MSGPNPNAYACPYKNTDRKTIIFMHFLKRAYKNILLTNGFYWLQGKYWRAFIMRKFYAAPEYSGDEGNLPRKVGEMEPKRKIKILLLTCLLIGENGFVKIDR